MSTEHDALLDDAFQELQEVHGDSDAVLFYLLEAPDTSRSLSDVIWHLAAENDTDAETDRSQQRVAHVQFDLTALPRTLKPGDTCVLPIDGNSGRWSFDREIERVGTKTTARFTQQFAHRGGRSRR